MNVQNLDVLVGLIHPIHHRVVPDHRDLYSSAGGVAVQRIGPPQGPRPIERIASRIASRVFVGSRSMSSITSMETSNRYGIAQVVNR